ncbi:hypothetical protein [Nocardioides marmoraquaticus]
MTSLAKTATLTHGYTLDDVDRATRIAQTKHKRSLGVIDNGDRYEIAWGAIVERLYECGCGRGQCTRNYDVTFGELLIVAARALDEEVNAERRDSGHDPVTGDERPSFVEYWLPVRKPKHHSDDGFSDRMCDRLMLRHALSTLSGEQYEALAALAAFDNVQTQAAEALGLTRDAYRGRVTRARAQFREAWLGEVPPTRDPSVECQRGHLWAEHGEARVDGKGKSYTGCRKCKDEREIIAQRRRRSMARMQAQQEAEAALLGIEETATPAA